MKAICILKYSAEHRMTNCIKRLGTGWAVTIEAGEHIPVYQEVKERLAVRPRVAR